MKFNFNFSLLLLISGLTCCTKEDNQIVDSNTQVSKASSSVIVSSRQKGKKPSTSLPYSLGMLIFDSLTNEAEYEKQLFKILDSSLEEHSELLKELKIRDLTIEDIHNSSKSFAPFYYAVLLNEESKLSHSYLLEILPSRSKSVNVLLLLTKITKRNSPLVQGGIIEIVTYSDKNSIVQRHPILVAGIGRNDEFYYECFSITNDYKINLKSYLSVEGEFTTIKRKLKVTEAGRIEVIDSKVNVQRRTTN